MRRCLSARTCCCSREAQQQQQQLGSSSESSSTLYRVNTALTFSAVLLALQQTAAAGPLWLQPLRGPLHPVVNLERSYGKVAP